MKHPWASPRELFLLGWLHPLPLWATIGHRASSFCPLVSMSPQYRTIALRMPRGLNCAPPPNLSAEGTVLRGTGFHVVGELQTQLSLNEAARVRSYSGKDCVCRKRLQFPAPRTFPPRLSLHGRVMRGHGGKATVSKPGKILT